MKNNKGKDLRRIYEKTLENFEDLTYLIYRRFNPLRNVKF